MVVLNVGKNTIEQMASFYANYFPALLALLIGMGGISFVGYYAASYGPADGSDWNISKEHYVTTDFLIHLVLISNINSNISLENLSKLTRAFAPGY